jgi:uncharacterized protein (TIGR04552 family)
LGDLEEIRHLLAGGSVVDWFRIDFRSDAEIERFLYLNEADPEDPIDLARLEALRERAAGYLQETFRVQLPDEVTEGAPFDLFRLAAGDGPLRADACMALKVMHIIHHIEARRLRYRIPLAEARIARLLVEKVDAFAASLASEGFPLLRYSGGEKSQSSLITKLLVKPEHHAATIHDRVRFRFIVEQEADVIPLIHRMTRRLLPFNYVVPGRSVNLLVNFAALVESHAAYREQVDSLQIELGREESLPSRVNEFSGPSFRVINFVADVPVRVPDEVLARADGVGGLGRVIFALAEFQVVDDETDAENEQGDNNHEAYKARQLERVWARLRRGVARDPTSAEPNRDQPD